MNLFQRINEVRKEVAYVQKDKDVSTGKSSYRAVTHDQVTAMVRQHMVKHGIVCFPSLVSSHVGTPPARNGEASSQIRYEAVYDFTFANCDDREDVIIVRIEAHAMDNADKAPGKALSYAKKYAVLKLFELETGEDEEGRNPDPIEYDPSEHIEMIAKASTLDELKKIYTNACHAASNAKNKAAHARIVKAKDARKAELEAN